MAGATYLGRAGGTTCTSIFPIWIPFFVPAAGSSRAGGCHAATGSRCRNGSNGVRAGKDCGGNGAGVTAWDAALGAKEAGLAIAGGGASIVASFAANGAGVAVAFASAGASAIGAVVGLTLKSACGFCESCGASCCRSEAACKLGDGLGLELRWCRFLGSLFLGGPASCARSLCEGSASAGAAAGRMIAASRGGSFRAAACAGSFGLAVCAGCSETGAGLGCTVETAGSSISVATAGADGRLLTKVSPSGASEGV